MWTDICQAFSSLVYRSSCRRGVAPQRLAALALAAAPLMVGAPGFYQTSAEDLALPLGQIIERVVCQHAPSQTYALYLPTTYSADRKWPILYVFEPGARGAEGVRLFRPAAERLGYIVAVSNNSHNGPSIISYTAMEAMWLDTHRRFSIDDRRVYTSGMSGGTQPATRLAIALGAGIIACAGPIQLPAVAKLDNKTFTWLGVAGDVDYNFDRNRDAVVDLSKRGVPARLVSFDGGHGWPPGDVLTRCMEWLELGAMRTARRPPDPAFIERMRQQGLARARPDRAESALRRGRGEREPSARVRRPRSRRSVRG
ncbi:MAG: hypothetical protein JXO72_03930 [Vicinamibacteria bacterium]|nr:hypothetical protein [Vicinamibacteria bacterium]